MKASPARSWLWLLLLVTLVTGCKTSPDKRVLQYLNTDGFGNRYTGNAEEDNYITIGDIVGITDSYNPEELTIKSKVDIDGTITLPEIGAVQVAGFTRTQIEALLMEKYHNYYDRLNLTVSIGTQNKVFFIFGEVTNTGQQTFPGDLTIFEAVMAAGPTRDTANLGRVMLIRPDPRDPIKIPVDINAILEGDSTYNVHVQERDIIFVPATTLAQLGYFLDALLFPVKQVLSGLSEAIWSLTGLSYISGNRNSSIF